MPGQEVTSQSRSARIGRARRGDAKNPEGEPVKKIKNTKKIKLKIERDILRTLQVNELRQVEGGTLNQNGFTAASGGEICCA
jgi:hypothetical protein